MYRLISINTVSMVKSRFQIAMLGSFVRSTLPFDWFTQGRLTLLRKVTSGGVSGYSGPQWIFRE